VGISRKDTVMAIFKSRKFWTAMVDVAVVLILYFVGKYGSVSLAEDMTTLIVAIQPVFIMVIGSIAYEDGQAKKAGTFEHWGK